MLFLLGWGNISIWVRKYPQFFQFKGSWTGKLVPLIMRQKYFILGTRCREQTPNMSEKKRFFTVDEANAVVPLLLEDVPRLQELLQSLTRNFPDVKQARDNAQWNGGSI